MGQLMDRGLGSSVSATLQLDKTSCPNRQRPNLECGDTSPLFRLADVSASSKARSCPRSPKRDIFPLLSGFSSLCFTPPERRVCGCSFRLRKEVNEQPNP